MKPELTTDSLRRVLKACERFCAKDTSRSPWMHGITIERSKIWATDAHVLLIVEMGLGIDRLCLRPSDVKLLIGSLDVGSVRERSFPVEITKTRYGAVFTFGDVGVEVRHDHGADDGLDNNRYARVIRDARDALPQAHFCVDADLLRVIGEAFDGRTVGGELHAYLFGGQYDPIQFHGAVAGFAATAVLMPMRGDKDPTASLPARRNPYDGMHL